MLMNGNLKKHGHASYYSNYVKISHESVIKLVIWIIFILYEGTQYMPGPLRLNKTSVFNTTNAYILCQFAQKAYLNKHEFNAFIKASGYTEAYFFEDKATDTQLYVTVGYDDIIISFRGTESIRDDITDLDIMPVQASFGKITGHVHEGFCHAFKSLWSNKDHVLHNLDHKGWVFLTGTILDCLRPHIYKQDRTSIRLDEYKRIWFTGHSLGGALATLAQAQIPLELKDYCALYTFGAPKVGYSDFASSFDSYYKNTTFRIVNNNDMVPTLLSLFYTHVGEFCKLTYDSHLEMEPSIFADIKDRVLGLMTGACCSFLCFPTLNNAFLDFVHDHHIEHYLQAMTCVLEQDIRENRTLTGRYAVSALFARPTIETGSYMETRFSFSNR